MQISSAALNFIRINVTGKITNLKELYNALIRGDESMIHVRICDGSFEQIIAGMKLTDGCSQGKKVHLEGDVARHTAKVVSNLVKVSSEDSAVQFDEIDLLASLMHDVEKATTRKEDEDGNVRFPEHEEKAANRVSQVAKVLGLNNEQEQKLYFLVKEHGNAHSLATVDEELQKQLVSSKYWRNLRLLQKADALSCYLNSDGSEHLVVHWNLFDELRRKL